MMKSTAVPRLSVFILELSELTHAHYREPVPLTPDLTKLMNICMKNLYFNQSSVFFCFSLSHGEYKALYDIDMGHKKMIFYFSEM